MGHNGSKIRNSRRNAQIRRLVVGADLTVCCVHQPNGFRSCDPLSRKSPWPGIQSGLRAWQARGWAHVLWNCPEVVGY